MPQYTIKDPQSGRTVTIQGDGPPPTAAELEEIFAKVNAQPAPADAKASAAGGSGSAWDAASRFFTAAASTLDPRPLLKVAKDIGATMDLSDPTEAAAARDRLIAQGKALAQSQIDQFSKARADYEAGHYSEMGGHALAGAVPLVGPAAAHAGERIASGDVAGGLGEATGLLLPSLGKYALEAKLTGSLAPTAADVATAQKALATTNASRGAAGALDALTPEQRATVAWAQQNGVPVDAATATGNKAVKAVQHIADRTLGGSVVASKADAAQARGLAAIGDRLAAKVNPSPVTAEQAGTDVTDAVQAAMKDRATAADAAYEQFRQIAAKNTATVNTGRQIPSGVIGADGQPITAPEQIQVEAPVDLANAKRGLQPLYDELKRQADLTPASMMGDKARALQALDKIVNGPDTASSVTVDQALSDLKSFARTDTPELRTAGQGAAAGAIKYLDASLRKTVDALGPDAQQALEAGRAATTAKYALGDIYQRISDEPVQAFNQATRAGDASIVKLRDLAAAAPAEVPKIGRAWLDGLLTKATESGQFDGRAGMAKAWEDLGPETKRTLFQDPGLRSDLDSFFKYLRLSSGNANPSGTASVVATVSHLHSILAGPVFGLGEQGAWTGIASLLHSRAGVQLLTQGIKIPLSNLRALSAWSAQAASAIGAAARADGGLSPLPVGMAADRRGE